MQWDSESCSLFVISLDGDWCTPLYSRGMAFNYCCANTVHCLYNCCLSNTVLAVAQVRWMWLILLIRAIGVSQPDTEVNTVRVSHQDGSSDVVRVTIWIPGSRSFFCLIRSVNAEKKILILVNCCSFGYRRIIHSCFFPSLSLPSASWAALLVLDGCDSPLQICSSVQ